MSWGGEAGSAAGGATSGAGSAASVPMASAGSTPSSGFSIGETNFSGTPAPADGSYVSMTPDQSSNMASYGSTDPSWVDKGMSYLERFQKGGKQTMGEAWKGKGNNPETYGYLVNKAGGMAQGGGNSAPPLPNMTVNYQQPDNEYLRKRRGY